MNQEEFIKSIDLTINKLKKDIRLPVVLVNFFLEENV